MTKHLLKIFTALSLIGLLFPYLVLYNLNQFDEVSITLFTFLLVLGIFGWFYIIVKNYYLTKNLTLFFRKILSGDLETGLKIHYQFRDEATRLAELGNKTIEQLRTYDSLRSERVSLSYRLVQLLLEIADKPLLIAQTEKKRFQISPAFQASFNFEQEFLSYEAIKKQPENSDFWSLLMQSTNDDTIPSEKTVQLKLPIREIKQNFLLKFIPLKDKDEVVKLVIISADPIA